MPSSVPTQGVNDLQSQFPEIAAEADGWDPKSVRFGSNQRQNWRCAQGHQYSAAVSSRTNGSGCPICAGLQVLTGFNDLKTKFPLIAAEADGWDPASVSPGSNRKQNWRCEEGHPYSATTNSRTRGRGCPICSGRQVLAGFNDLKTKFPLIASEADGWDPTSVSPGSKQKHRWRCRQGHLYEAIIKNRTNGDGCPICSGRQVLVGFNDLRTKFPLIAAEADGWDPATVSPGSNQRQNWRCAQGHQYSAVVFSRTRGSGCPICSGLKVLTGFNDLRTKFPEIAAEADGWDPASASPGSNQKQNWRCGEGHQYTSAIKVRTRGHGCPICSGRQVLVGFNDLQSQFPEIAAEADGWDPASVTTASGRKMTWRCGMGHQYSSVVKSRTKGSGCPVCDGKKVVAGYNDLKTKFPEVAAEADGWDPTTIAAASNKKKNWKCKEGHQYAAVVAKRTRGTGCPVCAETGFNPEKSAWFYLMQRPGEQQIGITNDLPARMKTHERNGWTLLEYIGPAPGDVVYRTELTLKKWLRRDVGTMEGTTENWTTTSMEVRSLTDLKARSGIQTDLF